MTKDVNQTEINGRIDSSILDNQEIHNEIRETILDYMIFEAKYMQEDEIEETTMQVKELLKLKISNKKDSISKELYDILKSKIMYDVEIEEYEQTIIKIMDKIIAKSAKKLEKELYKIVGIRRKRKNIFKRLFAVCMSDQGVDKEVLHQNRLTKREINALREVKQLVGAKKRDLSQIRRINNTQHNKEMLLKA